MYLNEGLKKDVTVWADRVLAALRMLHKKDPEARLRIIDLCQETGLEKEQVLHGLMLLARLGMPYGGVIDPANDYNSTWIQPTEEIFRIKTMEQLRDRKLKEHEDRLTESERIAKVTPNILAMLAGPTSPPPPPQQKIILAPCDDCGGERNHTVLREVAEEHVPDDPNSDIAFVNWEWQILRCSGCGETRFRKYYITSDDCHVGDSNPTGHATIYPTPQELKPQSYPNAPDQICDLYVQTVRAFSSGSSHLCAAGLRALVEAICAERGVLDGRVLDETSLQPKLNKKGQEFRSESLDGKIWGLAESNVLTAAEAAMLHKHRYLGNDALHEALAPTRDSLENALAVIEHMLASIYELPVKAAAIKRAGPTASQSTAP